MEDRGLKINRTKTVYLRFNVDGNLDGNSDINLGYTDRIWNEKVKEGRAWLDC